MLALLTDFQESEFTGILKAVILKESSRSQIIDLCHSIHPQSILEGAWVLLASYKFFQKKTVFCCVVDPGTGTKRNALAIQTKNYFFVGPDNGLMWAAATEDGIKKIVELPIPKKASRTFHGRDVFAPAAARLEKGLSIAKLGKPFPAKKLTPLSLKPEGRKGKIVRIDAFGNLVTNLPSLQAKTYLVESEAVSKYVPFFETYAQAREKQLFLTEGSSGTLEFSVKGESAEDSFRKSFGFPTIGLELEIR